MQTLWARVAQVRGSCRCPQCLSTANGISRRATGTATRRMPKYLTSSTLWYSGVFAAAATFDAGMKMRRREQWDQAIAGVKQELEQSLQYAAQEDSETVVATENLEQEFSEPLEPLETYSDTTDAIFKEEQEIFRPFWPTNTGPPLQIHNLAPESVFADKQRQILLEKNTYSPKKLASIQHACDIIILKFLHEVERLGWSEEAAAEVPPEFAKHFLRRTTALERSESIIAKEKAGSDLYRADAWLTNSPIPRDDMSFCDFKQGSFEGDSNAVKDLNRSLQDLFALKAAGKISKPATVARAVYNLSSSSAPPDLLTFNIIMHGVSKLQAPNFLNIIIPELRRANARPNEVTLGLILRHYTQTNQEKGFNRWLKYVDGEHGGLALANPWTLPTVAGARRLKLKESQPEKLIQLPYPTPYVFSAIIEGVLKFHGFENALLICRELSLKDWGICMTGLTPLLQHCAEHVDWKSGSAVWSQIQSLKILSRTRVGSTVRHERIKLETYAAMLRLCSRAGRREAFDKIWNEAAKEHRTIASQHVRSLGEDNPVITSIKNCLLQGEKEEAWGAARTEDIDQSAFHSLESADIDTRRLYEGAVRELSCAPNFKIRIKRSGPKPTSPSPSDESSTELAREPLESDNTKPVLSHRPLLRRAMELSEEQLHGLLPGGHDLDEYELGERPMQLYRKTAS